jgi:hypothetical protein
MVRRGELLRQRIGALALGYEDLNDHDRLRLDPLHALLAGSVSKHRLLADSVLLQQCVDQIVALCLLLLFGHFPSLSGYDPNTNSLIPSSRIQELAATFEDYAFFRALPAAGCAFRVCLPPTERIFLGTFHTIIRMLAYKWIKILTRAWHNHELYNEERYLQCLITRGSPICKYLSE